MQATYHPIEHYQPIDNWDTGKFPLIFGEKYFGWNGLFSIEYLVKSKFHLSTGVGLVFNGSNPHQFALNAYGLVESKGGRFLYLTIHPMIHYHIVENEKLGIYAGIGVDVGGRIYTQLPDGFNIGSLKIEENLRPAMFNLQGRGEIRLKAKKFFYGLSCNYHQGLTKLVNFSTRREAPVPFPINSTIDIDVLTSYSSLNFILGFKLGE